MWIRVARAGFFFGKFAISAAHVCFIKSITSKLLLASVAMSRRRCVCAVVDCLNKTYVNQDLSFHSLPSDTKRCKLWLKAAGREDLLVRNPKDVRKSFNICRVHFDDLMFENNHIQDYALPIYKLPQLSKIFVDKRSCLIQTENTCLHVIQDLTTRDSQYENSDYVSSIKDIDYIRKEKDSPSNQCEEKDISTQTPAALIENTPRKIEHEPGSSGGPKRKKARLAESSSESSELDPLEMTICEVKIEPSEPFLTSESKAEDQPVKDVALDKPHEIFMPIKDEPQDESEYPLTNTTIGSAPEPATHAVTIKTEQPEHNENQLSNNAETISTPLTSTGPVPDVPAYSMVPSVSTSIGGFITITPCLNVSRASITTSAGGYYKSAGANASSRSPIPSEIQLNSVKTVKSDTIDIFCKKMAVKLKALPEEVAIRLQHHIDNLISYETNSISS